MQFANLLEKQTSKKIYFFINPGKYYLPIWKDETTLIKMHAQLTYKQNEKKKKIYKHTLQFSLVVLLFYCRSEKLTKFINWN